MKPSMDDNFTRMRADILHVVTRRVEADILLEIIGIAHNEGQLPESVFLDIFMAKVRHVWPDLAKSYTWLPWPE